MVSCFVICVKHVLMTMETCLIFQYCVWRQVQYSFESISDSCCCCLIACCAIPNRNNILLVSDGHYCATNFIVHHELFAQDRQDKILPATRGKSLPQSDDPLTPARVGLVLDKSEKPNVLLAMSAHESL